MSQHAAMISSDMCKLTASIAAGCADGSNTRAYQTAYLK
jgi:hypothetical protein